MATAPLRPSEIPRSNDQAVLDWVNLAVSEGQGFLRGQSGFSKIPEHIKAIMGDLYSDTLQPTSRSNIALNNTGKVALDLASSLTDIKPFWEYKTNNPKYELQAGMYQKRAALWWDSRLIDIKFCHSIKYAIAAGTGYSHIVYDPNIQDQNLIAEDPQDVYPIRPTGDFISVQDCFGVCIRRERTVNYLRAMYPAKANMIQADRDGSAAGLAAPSAATVDTRSGFLSNLFGGIAGRGSQNNFRIPVSDAFTVYVKDDSQNLTGERVLMGEAGKNWSYWVAPGEPLYPRGRAIVATRTALLYDGPNIYFHGLFPIPKLTLDPWPFSWLGKAPIRDLMPLQYEIDRTARGIADLLQKNWKPDAIGDSRNISKAAMDKLDTRAAGLRLRTNPVAGEGMKLQYPELAGLPHAMAWITYLDTKMKELSGTQELTSLVQMGQIPSSETIERMIESFSPAIRLRSRVMEAFLREFAMITLSNFMQFDTVAMRTAMLGPKGLTMEDADYDPGNPIPDMLNEGKQGADGNPLPLHERARAFLRNFTYEIAPGSLLAASEITDKMMYLQLSRMNMVDPITVLEKLGINNIGAPPEAGDTIMSRLQWFAQQQSMQMPVGPAGATSQQPHSGRKASAQAMPRIVTKES